MIDTLVRVLGSRRLPYFLIVCAIILALPSLWTGWQQDDLVHRYVLLGKPDLVGTNLSRLDLFRFLDGDTARAHRVKDLGLVPWWTLESLRLSFWRPLSSLTHWMDYLLWPDSALLMHLQSIGWYALLLIAALLLYRRFSGAPWVAGLAALFFTLDDAHGLAVGWIANRNALIAGFFAVAALLAHDRWRREKWLAGAFLGPGLLMLALVSGESALAICGYLLAHAIFIDLAGIRARVMVLVPYAAVAIGWMITYSLLGYGTWGSGYYVDPIAEPADYILAVIRKGPILIADQWFLPPSAPVVFLSGIALDIYWIWGVVITVLVGVLLYPLLRRDATARFWCTGMLLSIPLVCSSTPHSRLLLFAGVGAFGLLAQWIGGVVEVGDWMPEVRRRPRGARAIVFAFLTVHIVVAALLFPVNATSARFGQRYIQDAASQVNAGKEFEEQDLVIVNHPVVHFAHLFQTVRILDGQTFPRRLRVLAPAHERIHLFRSGERELLVRPEGGFLNSPFDNVYRGPEYPLAAGERVELTGFTAEITSLTTDGRPAAVLFTFAVPLEDVSLRWLAWGENGYTPFTLPAVGESADLEARPLQLQ